MTAEDKPKLKDLPENRNFTIKGAYKCGKTVVMGTKDYINHRELLLNYRDFYKKLAAISTTSYSKEGKQKTDDLLRNNYMTKQK